MPIAKVSRLLPTVLAGLVFAHGSAAKAATPDGFGWFGNLAGACWTGTFPDGKTTHTQCYTRQFDKFVRGTATLAEQRDGAAQTLFEGDSVFAFDEGTRRIVYYIWGSDGVHRRLEAHYIGDELAFPVESRKQPGQIAYRSVWRRLGDDAFEVRRERPSASEWNVELRVVYRRISLDPRLAPR
jgi:hypothetical protein